MVEVAWTGVAIVDVVGVFPNVNGQQRLRVGGQRGTGVAGGDDSRAAVGILTSRSSQRRNFRRGIGKFGFKIREAAERFGDCGRQFAFRFAAGVRRRAVPVEVWFQTCAALLNTPSDVRTISSRDLPSNAVPLIRLLRLVTYARWCLP